MLTTWSPQQFILNHPVFISLKLYILVLVGILREFFFLP